MNGTAQQVNESLNQAVNTIGGTASNLQNCIPYPYTQQYPYYYTIPLSVQYTLALAVLGAKGVSPSLRKKAEAVIAAGLK